MPIVESHDGSTPHSLTHPTVVNDNQFSHNNNKKICSTLQPPWTFAAKPNRKVENQSVPYQRKSDFWLLLSFAKFLYASAAAVVRSRPIRTEGEIDAPPLSQTAPSKADGVSFRRHRDVASNVWHLLQTFTYDMMSAEP